MRLSRLLKLSFVGTLIFTPAMAQEADKVHEEALKVLRGGTNSPSATTAAPAPRGPESRSEREARLKEEAQRRLAERDRIQAERRRQFEEYVRERERLREGKPATGDNVHDKALEVLRQTQPAPATITTAPSAPIVTSAPQTAPAPATVAPAPVAAPAATTPVLPAATTPAPPATPQPSTEEIQRRALEILRQQNTQQPATAAPVRESELAPRVLATPAPAAAAPAQNTDDIHQKALEVLRQQSQPAPALTTPQSVTPATPRNATPPPQDNLKPSPELQRRLDEMQRDLQNEQRRSRAPQVDEAYTKDLEQRALQTRQQPLATPAAAVTSATPPPTTAAPATAAAPRSTPPPRLDPRTSEIIQRQSQQLSTQSAPASDLRPTLDPAAEAKAREILRQQQQQAAVSASTTAAATQPAPSAQPAYQSPAPASTPAPAFAAAPASAAPVSDVQYSRELEERARQMLLQRSQDQQATTASPAPASTAPGEISTAPLKSDAELSQIHRRAMETLVQVEPGDAGQARFKSKQERIRALTELYVADKLTPAEYHQRRAQILAEPNK